MNKLKQHIRTAFASVEYPGDTNLRNSNEGDEPFLLEAEFKGKDDWNTLTAEFIDLAPDGFASALSFFSADAFRFYLPAYLIADVDGKLQHADLSFHLTHGLTNASKDVCVNPKRYGELTWFDYVSERFAGFTMLEAKVIVTYLEFKLEAALTELEREPINQALKNYWEVRAHPSPTSRP